MHPVKKHLFTSQRLGFRNWEAGDEEIMVLINSDPEVMEFFPSILSISQTQDFINRMKAHFLKSGFCYFAVDKLENNECVGFVGLMEKGFESDFTPCIDIGWRLARKEWNKGFATEGAGRCLRFAFEELHLNKIYSIAPAINIKSELIMQKIGMKKVKNFKHPQLMANQKLQECVLYEIIHPE